MSNEVRVNFRNYRTYLGGNHSYGYDAAQCYGYLSTLYHRYDIDLSALLYWLWPRQITMKKSTTIKDTKLRALKRARTRRLARLGARVYYLRKRGRDQEMYNLICEEFLALGGVYIKFLQGVLFNSTVMRRWQSPHKLNIFENVDQEKMDVVALLQKELTPDQLQQIALVQPEPFAAGSFGQVYLAQHSNGKQIVIKVLRPMVRELLKFDLRLLGLFSKRFAAREYDNLTIKMNEAYREFRTATLNETDYITEAHFAHDLYEAYLHDDRFVIPETYLELSTKHIIVQDYVEGVSGAELLKLKAQGTDPVVYVREQLGSDLDEQLRVLGVECLSGAFSLPHIQGDPHPGNVRFLPNNQVGMIDFGISAPAPRNKAALFGILEQWHLLYSNNGEMADLFEQFIRFFVNDLYRALKRLSTFMPQQRDGTNDGIQTPGVGGAAQLAEPLQPRHDLLKDIGRVVQHMFDSAMGTSDVRQILDEGRVLQAFNHLVNRGNRLGLVVRLESSEILRAGQTYMAMVETLGRRNEVIPAVLAQSVWRVAHLHSDIIHQSDKPVSVTRAIDIVNKWLERVAVRDPSLFKQLLGRIDLRSAQAAAASEPKTRSESDIPIVSEISIPQASIHDPKEQPHA